MLVVELLISHDKSKTQYHSQKIGHMKK